MNYQTASQLDCVSKSIERTYDSLLKALEQAENFTTYGFEVAGPTSFDGETYTITITR